MQKLTSKDINWQEDMVNAVVGFDGLIQAQYASAPEPCLMGCGSSGLKFGDDKYADSHFYVVKRDIKSKSRGLTNEEKQAILDSAPGDAQYYSIIDGEPMFYKLTLGGWSAFKLKNVCDKEKQWLRHSPYSISGAYSIRDIKRIDLLKAETKEWEERQQKIVNVINLSGCNVPLLVALGWDEGEITRNVTEMSHIAGSLKYARYIRTEKDVLEPEQKAEREREELLKKLIEKTEECAELKSQLADCKLLRTSKTVEYDNALNEAGWEMVTKLQELGPLTGEQFNNMKSCLKSAIEKYLSKK